MQTRDSLTLTIPNESRFYGVVRMLVGGLASRLGLAFEKMDDLQLAVETALRARSVVGTVVTLEAVTQDSMLTVSLGPVDPVLFATSSTGFDLRRLLGVLVEAAAVEEREDVSWLRLDLPVNGAPSP